MVTSTGPIRDFPSASDYQEALQHPQLCFNHPELKASVPELTKLRLPRPISGAFASVFSLTSNASGRRYAVKCFTRHVPDQEARYQAISEQLATLSPSALSQPWKMGFEYLPDAIQVGRGRYPVLKMEWVKGVTLSAWLDHHHRDSAAVDRLADHFSDLTADLAAHSIAHGDLQHGNLLVADDGTLRLVDYDGMYVPALSGRDGTERGHRNYQSPARGSDDFGAEVDRFSTWVIYLALKAVAIDPALWPQLHEPQGEYLLLAEDDFKNPSISPRFPALLSHSDREVRDLADQVRSLAWQPLNSLPPLMLAPAASVSAAPSSPTATPGTLPSWMTGHLPPSATMQGPSPVGLPARFTGRRALDAFAAVLLLVALVIPAVLLAAGTPTAYSLFPTAVAVLVSRTTRRSRTETQLLREHTVALKQQHRAAAQAEKAAAALRLERERLDSDEDDRKANLIAQRNYLVRQHQTDLAEAERRKLNTWASIDHKISAVESGLQAALARALAAERAGFVQTELQRSRVSAARLPGIGEKLKSDLAASGIRTAADFSGVRLRQTTSGGYNNTTAVIVTATGHEVNVKGIGEAKARALDAWRAQLVSAAQARCTIQLSSSRRLTVTSEFDRQRAGLANRRRAAETEATNQRNQAALRLQDGQTRLSDEAAAAADRALKQREEFARRAIQIQNSQNGLASVEASFTEARRIRRALSYSHYLRFALIGH
ncbi:hypothetical protein [Kitasatospora purpeofusca]|uniref:hypothetical protein n=1 Tax=Kitasatospora purpeofusca TaxID=67352 RepID=UPI00386ECC0D|nr:hypothetical protein OIP63_20015 [Kitasatospora purpeofusca]